MSQVHISSQTHTVTVNHDGGDLSYIVEKAQKLWDDTKPPEAGAGPAFGFTSQQAGGYRSPRLPYGGRMAPVEANGESS